MKPLSLLAGALFLLPAARADQPWVTYDGHGPNKGRRIVLVSGDEEYRSEEALPQLGKILATHHGFTCTVLFAVDPKTGEIDPKRNDNIPGLEALQTADLMVMFLRFRNLPDDQMKFIADYVAAGKPIVALRTSTHAFNNPGSKAYANWAWNSKAWSGGFGRQVLGETWISHHGDHGRQSCRGIVAPGVKDHPVLVGIKDGDVWGPTDVYGVRLPLPDGCKPLLLGQVLDGMKPDSPPATGPKNNPMMPIAWVRDRYADKDVRLFTTTMGSSQDLQSEGFRRLLVNACYWAMDLMPGKATVDLVGEYTPSPFKFDGHKRGVKPADLTIK